MYTPYDNLTDKEFLRWLDGEPQTPLMVSMRKRLTAAFEAADSAEPQYCDECGDTILNVNRPRIYKCAGIWYCLDGRWLGWSNTAQAAYANWKARGLRRCSHQR